MTTEHDERVAELLEALRHAESVDPAPRRGCRTIALYGDGSKPGASYEFETEEQRQRRAGEESQAPADWDSL